MRKLLIVLAIQFCLPACSALLARLSPSAGAWHLEIYTVLINTAFFGFALALLPKRWPWMVGMVGLIVAYALVWLPDYLAKHPQALAPLRQHFVQEYFEYLICTAGGVGLVCGFLFQDYALVSEMPAEQWGNAAPHWQWRLPDLLWATGLVAFATLGIMSYYRYRPPVPDDFESLFVLSGGDYAYAAIGLPFFFYVLRPGMSWRWLAWWGLGFLAVVVLVQPFLASLTSWFNWLFFAISILLLALGSALLYRWAGLRIVDYKTRSFWAYERPGKR